MSRLFRFQLISIISRISDAAITVECNYHDEAKAGLQVKLIPEEDLKEFWKIQREYLKKHTFDYVKRNYSKNKNLYVGCYKGHELIGIAYGFVREKEVVLDGIAVKHVYWKRGIGKKLLRFFEKQVKKLKIKKISTGVAKNVVKFYNKSGYKPIKEKPKFVVMEKGI